VASAAACCVSSNVTLDIAGVLLFRFLPVVTFITRVAKTCNRNLRHSGFLR
jgi:hypothetical protein